MRNSASLCTWPGPERDVDEREHARRPAPSSTATSSRRCRPRGSGSSLFSRLASPRWPDEPVVRLLADRAGVEEDQVGAVARLDLAVAERLEHALHALGVVLVHLAPEGGEVVRLHAGPRIAWARVDGPRASRPDSAPACPRSRRGRGRPHVGFTVRGKRFAWLLEDHHGDGRLAAQLQGRAGRDAGAGRTSIRERFFIPAYLGARGWIGLWLDTPEVDWDEVERLVVEALPADRAEAALAQLDCSLARSRSRGSRGSP